MSLMAEKSKSVPFLDAPKNLNGLVGDKGFDPIGFSDYIDVRFLREAELKHARIAMLAFLGFVGTEFVKLPDHNYGPVQAHDIAVSSGAMAQILTFVAALEFISVVAVKQMLAGSGRAPGDYGFDPLSFSAKGSQKDKDTMALKELGMLTYYYYYYHYYYYYYYYQYYYYY